MMVVDVEILALYSNNLIVVVFDGHNEHGYKESENMIDDDDVVFV
jgi:hypothetical protein